ncbi:MAG TPA: hypothetical protein VGH54_23895 [Mycobacterium sp.]|uniref:hypothetical protein n=1 Tax=Mycobacterium sp. TaxID=1785 RepID=UPI002F3F0BBD
MPRTWGEPRAVSHAARGLCTACWSSTARAGRLEDFETHTYRPGELATEWELLAGQGFTVAQAAERLRVPESTLRSALRKNLVGA